MPIQLEIVTPEKRILSMPVDAVRAPGFDGSFGVLPGHTPFVAAMQPGELSYTAGGREHHFFVGGGFAQVGAEKVIVLAESAESVSEIDLARAEASLADATQRLKTLREEQDAYRVERARVQRATARVTLARKR